MRGFLGFLIVAALGAGLLGAAVVYVALPAMVAATVQGALHGDGQAVSVRVSTSLDGLLAHGWIDEVAIDGTGVRLGTVTADKAAAILTDVSIVNRSFAGIDGTLSGVTLGLAGGGTLRIDRMDLSGPSTQITAIGQVDPKALETAVAGQLGSLGISRDQVTVTNGEIRLVILGRTIVASLAVEGSSLVLSTNTPLGLVPILEAPADGSWRLVKVVLSSTGAEFTLEISGSTLTGSG